MATVKITVTDAPGGVTLVIEGDPPIPMNGQDPDVDALTPGQAMAIGALMQLCKDLDGDWRVLLL